MQRRCDARVLKCIVVQVVPEKVRAAARLRREELAIAVLLRAGEVAVFGATAGRREQGLHHEDARHVHQPDVAPVQRRFVTHDLAVKRRRRRVHAPAHHAESTLQPFHRDRLGLERVFLGPAQRVGMDKGEMREVGQVVDDQPVVGRVVHVAGLAAPGRIAQVGNVDDARRVGPGHLAHPDPYQVVAFDHRIAAHAQLGGDGVLPRNLHTAPAGVELEAVIHAAHAIAFAPAVGKFRAAMAAAVVQRHRLSALAPIKQHRLFEQGAGHQLAVDQLVVPRGDVPAVLEEIVVPGHGRGLR